MDTAISTESLFVFSVAQLAAQLGAAAGPLIVDVRKTPAFNQASHCLPGALRIAPEDINATMASLPPARQIVVYCVHGHEVSQGVTATLRAAGLNAHYLQGGIAAWEEAGLPTMKRLPEFGLPASPGKPTAWVTRERPKIDRIACPWLIRRFIDPSAKFLYVPTGEVASAARTRGAIPYDVPKVQFSHRGPEGERCSFDAFLDDCGLTDSCLLALANIVRGADTGKPELTPQSPGLLAISLGLSVNYPDDHTMLAQGMVIYDALYAWIKSAQAEVHNAKLFKKA